MIVMAYESQRMSLRQSNSLSQYTLTSVLLIVGVVLTLSSLFTVQISSADAISASSSS